MYKIALFIGLMLISQSLSAALRVPSEYPTIQEAVTAATNGDTVLVEPGTYAENIEIDSRNIVLTSEFGPDSTFLTKPTSGGRLLYWIFCHGETELSGFTIHGILGPLYIDRSTILIKNNIFRNNIGNQIFSIAASPTITRNLFYDNIDGVSVYLSQSSLNSKVINNTFDLSDRGVFIGANVITVTNNIFSNMQGYGINGTTINNEISYNCTYNTNPLNPGIGLPEDGNIVSNPYYETIQNNLYVLSIYSPCINTGNPNLQYTDQDGTVSDMGFAETDRNPPFSRPVVIGPLAEDGCIPILTPTISWSYNDLSASTQTAYQIQVSSDSTFVIVDEWESGIVTSSNLTAIYSGIVFDVFNEHFVRVRVDNGSGWGDWSGSRFCYRPDILTINVPSDLSTIQEAIYFSYDNDTVLVSPGTYVEELIISNKAIHLISTDGPLQTIISPQNAWNHVVSVYDVPAPGLTLSGFTLTGLVGDVVTLVSNSILTIDNNIFRDNITFGHATAEVIALYSSTAQIHHNLFYNNGGVGCVAVRPGSKNTVIMNNTFDSNENGICSITNGGTAFNNIITNSSGTGIGAASASNWTYLNYNNIYGNDLNYGPGAVAGANSISVDPIYNSPLSNLYTLQPISPCIDAGDPNPIYNDPDFSQSDIGAFHTVAISQETPIQLSPIDFGSFPEFRLIPLFSWTESVYPDPLDTIWYRLSISTNFDLTGGNVYDSISTTPFEISDSLEFGNQYWWQVTAFNQLGVETASSIVGFHTWTLGDLNNSFSQDIGDLSYMVDYLFRSGPAPNPIFIGDLDGNCTVGVTDLTVMVDFMFRGGPPLQPGCE